VNTIASDIKSGAAAHCYLYFDSNFERRQKTLLSLAKLASGDEPIIIEKGAKVADISEAVSAFYKPALSGETRILLSPATCTISVQGQNKLLKTLEEPPPNSLVLLGAEKADLLLVTVLSRAKKVWAEKDEFAGDLAVARQVLDELKTSRDVPRLSKTLPDKKQEMLDFVTQAEQVILQDLLAKNLSPITAAALQDVTIWARQRLNSNVSPSAVAESMLIKIVEVRHFTK